MLEWFTPSVVQVEVLLQCLWEAGIGWDDEGPTGIQKVWERWRRVFHVDREIYTSMLLNEEQLHCYYSTAWV